MMGFFKQPKPRRFSHPYQYVDERKERIKEIEMRAKKELGMLDQEPPTGATVKGSFLHAASHTTQHISKRKAESGSWQSEAGLLVLLMIILIVVGIVLIY